MQFPEREETWQKIFRIGKAPHIHFVTAITNTNHQVIGYAEIVFAASAEAVSATRRRALETVLYVLLIILTVTGLLYMETLTYKKRVESGSLPRHASAKSSG